MNKGITVLILVAIVGAMGFVLYSHTRHGAAVPQETSSPLSAASSPGGQTGGLSSPLQAPQDGSGGLRQIDPPLTSGKSGVDGAPAPVRINSGNTGIPTQTPPAPATPPSSRPTSASLPGTDAPYTDTPFASTPVRPASGQKEDKQSAVSRPPSGSPELTPWGTPSSASVRPTEPSRTDGTDRYKGKSPSGESASSKWEDDDTAAAATPPPPSAPQSPSSASPVPSAKEPVLSDKDSHVLKTISVRPAGQNILLRIEADTPFPCRAFILNNPDRMVVDLPGSWKGIKAPTIPQNRLVKAIRVGAQPAGPRIVLDLTGSPKGHTLQRNGNTVEILVQ
ncbi:MAG: AMIN domain-containing protein [Desulfovibrio sp.]|jgi:hypothetical protein|nr:AMIN domain-containing protein [Desulfovibrio sp.]